uniref:PLAT domain-containing protein n=1 Tax=Octopus bimaculoides TaxID=37653 RepID=A0A0L8I0J4_OCTBM
MGNAVRRYLNSDFLIFVRTGDRKHASTDANVKIILINEDGVKSYEIVLDNILRDDFKKGASDTFSVRNLRDFGRVEKIEFWRDNAGVSPDWYVEKIMVENVKTNEMSVFPVFRWIKANYHYKIRHLDTVLPQDDEQVEQRKMELEDKRKIYIASQKGPGLPMMSLILKRLHRPVLDVSTMSRKTRCSKRQQFGVIDAQGPKFWGSGRSRYDRRQYTIYRPRNDERQSRPRRNLNSERNGRRNTAEHFARCANVFADSPPLLIHLYAISCRCLAPEYVYQTFI